MSNAHVISKVWTTTKVCLFSIPMLKNAFVDYFSSCLISLLHEIYTDSLRVLSYAWEVYKLSIASSQKNHSAFQFDLTYIVCLFSIPITHWPNSVRIYICRSPSAAFIMSFYHTNIGCICKDLKSFLNSVIVDILN